MKQTRIQMGMPVTVNIVNGTQSQLNQVFTYFEYIDAAFSPYKSDSYVSRINRGEIVHLKDMDTILELADLTTHQTQGYFNVWHQGVFNPSGIVKGWAIHQAALQLHAAGIHNFYIDIGGDIQTGGVKKWQVGIQDPWDLMKIVKRVGIDGDHGIATSGSYIRGQHIYNPLSTTTPAPDIMSVTVIGPNVMEADRFATAAFAMGSSGIRFLESLPHIEGYMINNSGIATMTSGFEAYVS